MIAATRANENVAGNRSFNSVSTDLVFWNERPKCPTSCLHSSAVEPGHRRAFSSSDGPSTNRRTLRTNCT